MKILVSACLLGRCCKYSGGSNRNESVMQTVAGHEVLALCPEELAGLGTPRTPIEIVKGRLMDRDGRDVDAVLRVGVARAVATALELGAELAILQSRSPTCGVLQVYDGTFSGHLIPGSGVFAQALREAGVPVLDAAECAGAWTPSQ